MGGFSVVTAVLPEMAAVVVDPEVVVVVDPLLTGGRAPVEPVLVFCWVFLEEAGNLGSRFLGTSSLMAEVGLTLGLETEANLEVASVAVLSSRNLKSMESSTSPETWLKLEAEESKCLGFEMTCREALPSKCANTSASNSTLIFLAPEVEPAGAAVVAPAVVAPAVVAPEPAAVAELVLLDSGAVVEEVVDEDVVVVAPPAGADGELPEVF